MPPATAGEPPAGRIGLLGGTFDPPHNGHLHLARTALEQLKLDRVLFMPVGKPPHKRNNGVTEVEHRLEMVRLAVDAQARFELDRTDIDRAAPHTTATLLPLMQQLMPGVDLWLLIGSDSLRDLPSWQQPQQVIANCRLAVQPRTNTAVNWPALEEKVPGTRQQVDLLRATPLTVSSTGIRRRIKAGRNVDHLLPANVLQYIFDSGLYR